MALLLILIALLAPPAPQAEYSLVRAPCPYFPETSGCVQVDTGTIYIRRDLPRRFARETFQHELGHLYDWHHVDEVEMEEFKRIARVTDRRFWAGGVHEAEQFADAYAVCRLGYRPSHNRWRKPDPAVCRFIKEAV